METACLYIMANQYNGTFYVGVTSNLLQRTAQHKNGTFGGFSSKYNCTMLMFYTFFQTMLEAIEMEKKLKKSSRLRKIRLIEETNPEWKDLSLEF